MKKIFIALMMAGATVASCDMNMTPYGALDDQTAIQTLNDCFRFRNGLYTSMRSLCTGGYITYPEVQMDMFQGTIANGNRIGPIAEGNIVSSTGEFETIWANLYTILNAANYIIEKADGLRTGGTLSETDLQALARYEGEAKFVRAYCYYWLADHFCQPYSEENAETDGLGIPVVTTYYPTYDSSVYPGRGTQAATYKQIEDDLADAYTALSTFEQTDRSAAAPNAIYFSSYAVRALQARVALLKGDDTNALAYAEDVIESGIYPLAKPNAYASMWTNDEGTEVIFRTFMSSVELGSSTGMSFLNESSNMADYVPTYDALAMYEENDIRFNAFFTASNLNIQGTSLKAFTFSKYPGNPALIPSGELPNRMNMAKPFRTSELYLIAAEAAYNLGQTSVANGYINDLREQRISGYERQDLAGSALLDLIHQERTRELIGEGFRISDLRRWGEGFQRNPSHPEQPALEPLLRAAGASLSYPAGDHRFVWPIPSAELESNPQMAGQQNPGY